MRNKYPCPFVQGAVLWNSLLYCLNPIGSVLTLPFVALLAQSYCSVHVYVYALHQYSEEAVTFESCCSIRIFIIFFVHLKLIKQHWNYFQREYLKFYLIKISWIWCFNYSANNIVLTSRHYELYLHYSLQKSYYFLPCNLQIHRWDEKNFPGRSSRKLFLIVTFL